VPKLEKLHSSDWEWQKLGGWCRMTPKEKLLKEIEKIVSEMPEDKVKRVYQFVLHIAK
jgi:hypothetical protein